METVTVNGAVLTYTYDGYGRIEKQVTKYGTRDVLTEEYTFTETTVDGVAATSSQIATYKVTSGNTVTTYTYTYDDNGNILTVSDGTNTTSYVYDSANQLLRENNQAGGYTHTWTYDAAGNILNRKEYAYTTGSLGNAPNTVSYGYTDADWGDLLTDFGNYEIEYDAVGNPETYQNWSCTWEHGRQLASMSDGTSTWTYTYNADGLRTSKTNGTDTWNYVYNGSQLSQMTKGADTLSFTYDASGAPLTVKYNTITCYYETNLQGDVVAIRNPYGIVIVKYAYDAWGRLLSTTGSAANSLGILNPLRYRGYVYDQETGLYYVSSRYYDPEIGRWINADNQIAGVGGEVLGYNMFAYCMNNPVNMSDPSGNWPRWITAAVASVATVISGFSAKPTATSTIAFMAALAYVIQTHHYDSRASKNKGMEEMTYDEAAAIPGADLNVSDTFHDFSGDNRKVCLEDGREGIYDSSGQYVDDPRDIGTYNCFVPKGFWSGAGHIIVDVVPYFIFGNNDNDPGPIVNFAEKWMNNLITLFE